MPNYRWASPQEWLAERASGLSHEELLQEFLTLVQMLDGDTVQDEYQREMDAAGYFEQLD